MSDMAAAHDTTLIVVAAISALPALIVAVMNSLSHKRTRDKVDANTEKTTAVLHQVKNDHGTNLRDDIDDFKRETLDTLEKIEAAQGYLGGIVGNILGDIRKAKKHDMESALAIEKLETAIKPLQEALDKYENRSQQ